MLRFPGFVLFWMAVFCSGVLSAALCLLWLWLACSGLPWTALGFSGLPRASLRPQFLWCRSVCSGDVRHLGELRGWRFKGVCCAGLCQDLRNLESCVRLSCDIGMQCVVSWGGATHNFIPKEPHKDTMNSTCMGQFKMYTSA